MSANNRNISITGSTEFSELKVTAPSQYAAGVKAVKVALDHAFREMGVAKSFKGLAKMNQKEGFDCPGCAWPDPEKPSKVAEYCENGAKALAEEATNETVDRHFFSKYSIEEISQWTDYKIGKSGRITEPMILRPGSIHYEPIGWSQAYKEIAKHLKALDNPDEAIFYTSGRSSNEAAFLYGLFIRAFGTHNMPDCSNMCHESSGVALAETLGIGKGSVKLEDFDKAEVVMVIGQNPGTNHPRMLSALQKCKENGGTVISMNPLAEAGLIRFKNPQEVKGVLQRGEAIADIHLQVKINQDIAVMKVILKRLVALDKLNGNVFDHDFISKYTDGYESFIEHIQQYDEEALIKQSGVSSEEIQKVVDLLAVKDKIIICWAMGLTQHKNGVENIKECVNLLLLKGSLGREGAGTCPVRGHSNVQGDRSVGIVHHASPAFNAALKREFGFEAPIKGGYDVVEGIQAMHEGKAKVFMALGGNFVSAASDTAYTAEALQNCDLTINVSTKLNRNHTVAGKTSIILPTLGRSEFDQKDGKRRFFTVENSMGIVHRSKGLLKPISEDLKSEPEIIGGIANAYFEGIHPVDWKTYGENYEMIRASLERVLTDFKGIEKKSKGSGFYLRNNVRDLDFSQLPNGKAQFSNNGLPEHNLADDEFLLMTMRSHDQFNTTIYGMNDRYRGIYNERRIIFINQKDIEKFNFEPFEVVDLVSNYDGIERKAENFKLIPYNIPQGDLGAYFPETNMLVPINHFADKSQTPISKSVVVKIVKK